VRRKTFSQDNLVAFTKGLTSTLVKDVDGIIAEQTEMSEDDSD